MGTQDWWLRARYGLQITEVPATREAFVEPVAGELVNVSPVLVPLHSRAPDDSVGTWVVQGSVGLAYGAYLYNTSQSDGDEVSWENMVRLPGGTYDLRFSALTDTWCGIMEIHIDDALVGSVDLYSGVQVPAAAFLIEDVVLELGWHDLKIKVNNKNESSAGYTVDISGFLEFHAHAD